MKIVRSILAAVTAFLLCAAPAFAAESTAEEPLGRSACLPRHELRLPEASSDEENGEEEAIVWEQDPDGSVLTMSGGVNYYFDQKETYYNLDMDYVVEIAHSQGIEGEYWVREDGCKMLGDYIMVAANRDVHPQGSIIGTSLGLAVVVDTGSFAQSNPTQVDIAVNW